MVSKGLMTVKDLMNGACSCRTDPAITERQDGIWMLIYNVLFFNG